MWIVALALRRPYTFVVMALLILILTPIVIFRTPVDIFPNINIPVVSVIWQYSGMPPKDMAERFLSNTERGLTTLVNDIQHIESEALPGRAIEKIYFQPGVNLPMAVSQVTAISQTSVRSLPPGTQPPLIIVYSASSVPIVQIGVSSKNIPEQNLFDLTVNFVRPPLTTIKGASIPWAYGGKQRVIAVDLDTQALQAKGLTPVDIVNAVDSQNLILPSGTAKLGPLEMSVAMNGSTQTVAALNDLPVKTQNGATIYLGDVAHVRDGFTPQTNIVRQDGVRGTLLSVMKNGGASTLDIVKQVKQRLPRIAESLPGDLKLKPLFDQSLFVRASIDGVLREAAIAALLTAAMILLFLGDWRPTIVITISIPLSICVSIICLSALGETINIMTLGGLALAVGILVDDATVEIENIERNLAMGKELKQAILDGAQQIAVPAFVSTLCICIVFVPVVFIAGAAKSLFVPLAMAVVFAMLTSYFLSRTLVPTMMHALLAREAEQHAQGHAVPRSLPARFFAAFERGFERMRMAYGGWLGWALGHRKLVAGGFAVFVAGSLALLPLVGRDFFPSVDAGLIKLHVRGTPGTRIEETERKFAQIEDTIRTVIPPGQIQTLLDDIGIPYSGLNLSLSEGALISSADGEILIALKEGHRPTPEYVRALREKLHAVYPEQTFFFLAPDISTQVLNFGLAAPIDLQVVGAIGHEDETYAVAEKLAARVKQIPGAVDVHLAQVREQPALKIDVDRTMAGQLGLTERDVANDLLVSLASSSMVGPSYWLDPRGVQYTVAVQTPQPEIDSLAALKATPISTGNAQPQMLSNMAQVSRTTGPVNITHYNNKRTFDVQTNVDRADLGSVADAVQKVVDELKPTFARGTTVTLRGQAESMRSSFRGLGFGLIFAVMLVYLLMVMNFQSWLDPFIILMALPGAVAGIAWILFLTHTTLSVPALMGSIMCVGVATANSILVVTFANDQRKLGFDAMKAALAAGMTRIRPVLMTALAMIIGMLPMSLGLGEGGEQNAPLGRAVIGGLLLATITTLFFVPLMYSVLRRKPLAAADPLLEDV
jgi:multidrug efflux pump subunit AcrB